MSFVEELRWRGMLHDIIPGTEELLSKQTVAGYIGFDPTSDSLHIGNLAQIMLLLHFQNSGHRPVALIGGATGMVGDPSGKSEERTLLSEETLQHNLNSIKTQLEKFLDFNSGDNAAKLVNNYDWYRNMGFLEGLRELGKHITVSYMMAKDSVQKRLESGLSFTEFAYQLVQGYDFYYLWKHHGVKLQMGGSDQWGNIVTGTELIRRKENGEAFALTIKLITRSDGGKFGKTESGNIWLDRNKTSPYKFYQFWLNTSDEDARNYIRIFTLLTRSEIELLEKEHAAAPHLRVLQKMLARDVTVRVHSKQDLDHATDASEILFGNSATEKLRSLPEQLLLDVMEGVPMSEVDKNIFHPSVNITDLLTEMTKIFPSKGEARKMIQAGGVSINKIKITDPHHLLTPDELLNNRYVLVQKGKKNYFLIRTS